MPAAYVPSTCVQPKGKPVKIFSFLRHHKINFVIALVLLCIQANLELAVPGVMSNIVDIGIARGGIVGEAPVGATASELARIQTDYILGQGAHMLVLTLLSVACSILAAYNASKTSAAIGREVRHALYERVLSYSPAEMEKFSSASLITRATNDIQQIQMITVMCLRIVLFAPCMGVGAVVRVLSTPTGMEWILVVAICIIAIAIGILMGLTMPKFRRMQGLVDRNNLIAREILTGIMPIRAFGRQEHERARYDEANRELTGTYIFTNRAMAFLGPVMMIVMNATTVAIVWFGGLGVDAGTIEVGTLMAYINYVMQVIMSFMILTMISVMLPRAGVAAERVLEVLDTTTSIAEPTPEHAVTRADGAGWRGEIAFSDVTFAYPDADMPTLEHIDFSVAPGQTLGIIGSTGSGKSTLVPAHTAPVRRHVGQSHARRRGRAQHPAHRAARAGRLCAAATLPVLWHDREQHQVRQRPDGRRAHGARPRASPRRPTSSRRSPTATGAPSLRAAPTFPAGRTSGSRSRAPSPSIPRCSSSTTRSPLSITRRTPRCAPSSDAAAATPPSSSSPSASPPSCTPTRSSCSTTAGWWARAPMRSSCAPAPPTSRSPARSSPQPSSGSTMTVMPIPPATPALDQKGGER